MAKLYITTPFMKVISAYTIWPDKPYTEFNQAGKKNEPQYKIVFDPTPDDLVKIEADIREKIGPMTFKVKKPKLGVSISKSDGIKTVRPASKYKPVIFDMKNGKLQDPKFNEADGTYAKDMNEPKIAAGTVARAFCQLNPYEEGVSLQLISIQVKTLVEWEGKGGGSSPFEEGEGYTSENDSPFNGEDNTGSDNSKTDAGNDEATGSALDI